MTKEAYFEMCEMYGAEPIESDIPVEIGDFPEEVQTAFQIYQLLQDRWEGMSGTYMGKDLAAISNIFEIFEIQKSDRKTYLEYISIIDRERISVMDIRRKQEESLRNKESPK